jgi:hypothetical protein
VAKTDRNFIFHGCISQILNQLHIMVKYISFKKFQISTQNPKGLAFGFTEKRQFTIKTYRNFIFLDRKAQIMDQLHIMVMYISFYGFKKNPLKIQMS